MAQQIDKIEATRQAIENAKLAADIDPAMALAAFIRFIERTWVSPPLDPNRN